MKKNNANGSSKVKIMPLGDRVLIKEIKSKEQVTEGGIIIPENVADDRGAKKGEVVAVGEGRIDNNGKLVPMRVKAGDTVLFQWGDQLKIEGEEYHMVSEGNLLGIIK
jgi:chaperonin GroES